MRARLRVCILKALLACDGLPMPENALESAAVLMMRPAEPTRNDFEIALKELSDEGYALGATDDFTRERSWSLTSPKGEHQARKLK